MKKLAILAGAVALAALVALPWLRSDEHAVLDDAARSKAGGQYVTLSHGVVHYQLEGPADGKPVVLVHGFSVPSYVFDATRQALAAEGYRVASFDLYGRGLSDRPQARYDRDLLSDQVKELMDALKIPKADVIGLSMGGAVAGHFAALHPERVRSLVLISPFTEAMDISVMAWPVVGDWVFWSVYLPSLQKSQGSDFAHPEQYPGWADKFRVQTQYQGFGQALLSSGRNLISKPSLPDFDVIGRRGTPTLLVWGDQDKTIPYATSAKVLNAIPQARLVTLPGLGHLPVVENPPAANAPIVAFLRAQG
jgi:pimeloyl-ACP methyl ester carboxylesterase